MDRAVFLDRDGTINKSLNRYCLRPEELELFPWTAESIRLFNKLKLKVIIITNQAWVSQELAPSVNLVLIHNRMTDLLGACDARVDKIYSCTHSDLDNCKCRKPKVGLIREACSDYSLDLTRSYLVGDMETDIQVGKRAGCRTISVGIETFGADLKCQNLLEAAKEVERWEKLRQ